MGLTMYLYEKARVVHSQDLRREMEARLVLSCLPRSRRRMSRRLAGKLGVLLLKLGTWLKQFEQPHTTIEDHL
jgi:hypothetical protein